MQEVSAKPTFKKLYSGKSEVAASPQPTTKFMNNLDSAVHDHNNQNLESDTRNFLYQCYKVRSDILKKFTNNLLILKLTFNLLGSW